MDHTIYTEKYIDPDLDICAGVPDWDGNGQADGGKDSCQGDSGGPLICEEELCLNLQNNKMILNISDFFDCQKRGFIDSPGPWTKAAWQILTPRHTITWVRDQMMLPPVKFVFY